VVQPLIDYLSAKLDSGTTPQLNFICTHNSRRSQLAQVWAYTAARWYGIPVKTFSGGVEETAFNPSAIEALNKAGFSVQIVNENKINPVCFVKLNETDQPLATFSKLFQHESNPKENFAAVMTCSDADENCPYIPGAEGRIPLLYDDPKIYDNTPEAAAKYLERSEQIGSELLYAFRKTKKTLAR
jgi:arsenate reductase